MRGRAAAATLLLVATIAISLSTVCNAQGNAAASNQQTQATQSLAELQSLRQRIAGGTTLLIVPPGLNQPIPIATADFQRSLQLRVAAGEINAAQSSAILQQAKAYTATVDAQQLQPRIQVLQQRIAQQRVATGATGRGQSPTMPQQLPPSTAPIPGRGSQTPDVSGIWYARGGAWAYRMAQNNTAFSWVRNPPESANGTINGAVLYANWGTGQGSGRITQVDAQNRALRIQWDSGEVFERTAASASSGQRVGSQGVGGQWTGNQRVGTQSVGSQGAGSQWAGTWIYQDGSVRTSLNLYPDGTVRVPENASLVARWSVEGNQLVIRWSYGWTNVYSLTPVGGRLAGTAFGPRGERRAVALTRIQR